MERSLCRKDRGTAPKRESEPTLGAGDSIRTIGCLLVVTFIIALELAEEHGPSSAILHLHTIITSGKGFLFSSIGRKTGVHIEKEKGERERERERTNM
jgi:hypothetical protein